MCSRLKAPQPKAGISCLLIAVGSWLGMPSSQLAADVSPIAPQNPTPAPDASSGAPTSLEPVTVTGTKPAGVSINPLGYTWHMSEVWGSNFHIRSGQIVDAIGFRHAYLEEHPQERAVVVTVTRPPSTRVTQAVCAYTKDGKLRLTSVAIGDFQPRELTAADIDRPDVIRKYVQSIRDVYVMSAGIPTGNDSNDMYKEPTANSSVAADGSTSGNSDAGKQNAVANGVAMARMQDVAPSGGKLAVAEESGDYSKVTRGRKGPALYPGSSGDMLDSAFHWLADEKKVGLIPLARGRVNLDYFRSEASRTKDGLVGTLDAVVFDWNGMHYAYTDQLGTLEMPIPTNPSTGLPYLVLNHGDLMESVYFAATYERQHAQERTVLLAAVDGIHAAVAYTRSGQLWMMSPFLGRFVLPARYQVGDGEVIAKLHAALVAREMKNLPQGTASRPGTGVPQDLQGDGTIEQVRRAYLAFTDLGLPCKLTESDTKVPGLQVTYKGSDYSYLASN
jgi:hypothetical protein